MDRAWTIWKQSLWWYNINKRSNRISRPCSAWRRATSWSPAQTTWSNEVRFKRIQTEMYCIFIFLLHESERKDIACLGLQGTPQLSVAVRIIDLAQRNVTGRKEVTANFRVTAWSNLSILYKSTTRSTCKLSAVLGFGELVNTLRWAAAINTWLTWPAEKEVSWASSLEYLKYA